MSNSNNQNNCYSNSNDFNCCDTYCSNNNSNCGSGCSWIWILVIIVLIFCFCNN